MRITFFLVLIRVKGGSCRFRNSPASRVSFVCATSRLSMCYQMLGRSSLPSTTRGGLGVMRPSTCPGAFGITKRSPSGSDLPESASSFRKLATASPFEGGAHRPPRHWSLRLLRAFLFRRYMKNPTSNDEVQWLMSPTCATSDDADGANRSWASCNSSIDEFRQIE